jgi:ABC-type multidrug transport system ATPase subunit
LVDVHDVARQGEVVLRVDGVTKWYDKPPVLLRPVVRTATNERVEALRRVSFDVRAGEVVGLVGPNGAGKTTLIKGIGTLLDVDEGTIDVQGFDTTTQSPEVRSRIGLVLAEERGVYWRITARQNLELFGVLAGLSKSDARAKVGPLLALVGLADDAKRVFGYSTGMRGRLNIARALLSDPPLLVLDEPTRSLDPMAAEEVQKTVRHLADEGTAVLLSSHRLDEVAAICDRVVVLIAAEVRWVGTVAELDRGQGGAAGLGDLLRGDVEETQGAR